MKSIGRVPISGAASTHWGAFLQEDDVLNQFTSGEYGHTPVFLDEDLMYISILILL